MICHYYLQNLHGCFTTIYWEVSLITIHLTQCLPFLYIQNKTLSINIAIELYVLKIALEIKNLSHQLLEFPRSLWLRHVQEWLGLPTRNKILLANVKVIKSFSVSWNIWIWKILNNLLFAQITNTWQTKANFTPAVGFNFQ